MSLLLAGHGLDALWGGVQTTLSRPLPAERSGHTAALAPRNSTRLQSAFRLDRRTQYVLSLPYEGSAVTGALGGGSGVRPDTALQAPDARCYVKSAANTAY